MSYHLTKPTWPRKGAFNKLFVSQWFNHLPFGNHSKKVSLSENQTKNQSWKQYGRQTWARWKWELERSTCRVCLCWELQHRPFSTWLHIWTIERKYNWTRNLKETNMAVTALHDQKSSISGAPRTGLERMKRFWTRSGRLHKARWEMEPNDGLLPCLFLICDFSYFRYNCFSIKGLRGVTKVIQCCCRLLLSVSFICLCDHGQQLWSTSHWPGSA